LKSKVECKETDKILAQRSVLNLLQHQRSIQWSRKRV